MFLPLLSTSIAFFCGFSLVISEFQWETLNNIGFSSFEWGFRIEINNVSVVYFPILFVWLIFFLFISINHTCELVLIYLLVWFFPVKIDEIVFWNQTVRNLCTNPWYCGIFREHERNWVPSYGFIWSYDSLSCTYVRITI